MSHDYPKEVSDLIKEIEDLKFVNEVRLKGNPSPVNCRDYENTLTFSKNDLAYIASVRILGSKYKFKILIDGNRPNPCYEKKIKKFF